MNRFKRAMLLASQVAVVVLTVVAGAAVVARPEAAEEVLGEVARGVSGGLMFAGVKTLSRLSRPWRAGGPWWGWWCCGWAVSRQECRNALIGSFLLGLLLAVGSAWGGGH